MRHSRGFSIIETLASIVIASIVVAALLQVSATSSRSSLTLLENFDDSLMMGVMISTMDDKKEGDTLNVKEVIANRYTIDHPDILESLERDNYERHRLSHETLDPLRTLNATATVQNLNLEKIAIVGDKATKSFYIIPKTNNE